MGLARTKVFGNLGVLLDRNQKLWYSAKRAGVKRACPNKVMAHMWLMRDAHLGRAVLLLEILRPD